MKERKNVTKNVECTLNIKYLLNIKYTLTRNRRNVKDCIVL